MLIQRGNLTCVALMTETLQSSALSGWCLDVWRHKAKGRYRYAKFGLT